MKKVVCIGGGTGQSALLRGLKKIEDIELSAIVAVADDGGSTGRLRDQLHLPAMGDIRSVMVALAEREDLMTSIMNYRFDKNSGELSGHNLGNIIISALAQGSGDFEQAVTDLSSSLKVRGRIYPSTTEYVSLKGHMKDGSVVTGESELRECDNIINDVFYDREVSAYPPAVQAIYDADYIIVGIGSLFTSILPNLIITDIKKALCQCRGKVIYYCNCMSEHGETDGFSLEDHVEALERHLQKQVIDAVVFACDEIPEVCLQAYRKEHAAPVGIREKDHDYQIFRHSLLNFPNNVIRHDAEKTRISFEEVMREMG
ncbi:MAG: YvcK family protein [Erysipelotrichaceae bacterium]|nr:YvcK family protein [Erysipelotrichaceae bacterium]MBO4538395.1 YvcK family protein [Erysipelotrichaceae bacterium]